MKTIHEVHFPRYRDDIASEKRTLFHMYIDDHVWSVGDGLRLLAAPNFPRCKVGVLTDVRWVKLLAELEADLPKLCAADRSDYLTRWDLLHPSLASVNDPVVLRIEFRYGMWESDPTDPPEWSLAA
jgi:hypothetical protein